MKKSPLIIKLVLLLIYVVRIESCLENDAQLFHGTKAKPGQFPYVVSLQKIGNKESICGGALLAPKLVMTASHCLSSGVDWRSMIAVAGIVNAVNWDVGYQTSKIVEVLKSHPFPNPGRSNDLAILLMRSEFHETEYINFQSYGMPRPSLGAEVLILGWSALDEGNKAISNLHWAKARLDKFSACGCDHLDGNAFSCVRGNRTLTSGSQFCDSGSPGLYRGLIFGVSSKVKNESALGSFFTKLRPQNDWIERTLEYYTLPPRLRSRATCTGKSFVLIIIGMDMGLTSSILR
ncbi:unnamed protein product [Hermetia illucens]|uniref:Peptidase S1 domain-containing protein n=1 Tax=Hermetia illucens TaxID=343691 RepID=A0A7R8UGX9_HERIL|nr:unnamed protein product [Hermetia illucens]